MKISRDDWMPVSSTIYEARLPTNSLSNGSFESGTINGWRAWSANGDHAVSLKQNCTLQSEFCLSLRSGTANSETVTYPSPFPANNNEAIVVRFRLSAPVGARIRVVLRRASAPYSAISMGQNIAGTGSWQEHSFVLTALESSSRVRLDFGLSSPSTTIMLDDVRVEKQASNAITALFWSDREQDEASYPNSDQIGAEPGSPFLRTSVNSDIAAAHGGGSTYLRFGGEMLLPSVLQFNERFKVRIRTNSWTLEERSVTSRAQDRLLLDSPTRFPIQAGWGYYLLGQPWMIDEPGEWAFNPTDRSIRISSLDGLSPADKISVSNLNTGIEIDGLRFVTVEDIEIIGFREGVSAENVSDTIIRKLRISQIAGEGIHAPGARNLLIESNQISKTRAEAIDAANSTTRTASTIRISDNEISEVGVRTENGLIVSDPVPALAAVRAAANSVIEFNTIISTAYAAVAPLPGTRVLRNVIKKACAVLDDCGAVYLTGAGHNGLVESNIIADIHGSSYGKPPLLGTQAQGVYLDNQTSGAVVRGNSIINADNGIQVHNASFNRIERNKLYANRKYQIWFQENGNVSNPAGDIRSNLVLENTLFAVSPGAALRADTIYASTEDFANYDRNRYSALISPKIVSEQGLSAAADYSFEEWRFAQKENGSPRNLDVNGSVVEGIGYAAFRVLGQNIVPNGNLINGRAGWGGWNQLAPYNVTLVAPGCLPGTCLTFVAGGSESILSTPNFSVQKDGWYRLTFDLKGSQTAQSVLIALRRGGGGLNGYEVLAPSVFVNANTNWKRYSLTLKSQKTINAADPATGDLGARVDFQRVMPGQSVAIANVELVPISPAQASLETRILVNESRTAQPIYCPDTVSNGALCQKYERFSDRSQVVWPLIVDGHSSEIIYSRDKTLTDEDSDGIADYQDSCSRTTQSLSVNARGCALLQ